MQTCSNVIFYQDIDNGIKNSKEHISGEIYRNTNTDVNNPHMYDIDRERNYRISFLFLCYY